MAIKPGYKEDGFVFQGGDPKNKDNWIEYKEKSAAESLARGAVQEFTMGTADEISGGVETGLDLLTGKAQLKNIAENYKKRRDESRAAFNQAQKDNPGSYLAGELAGGTAQLFVPGLNVAGKAGLTAKAVTKAATYGAVRGFGKSDAEDAGALAQDTALGAATGLIDPFVPKIVEKAGVGLQKIGGLGDKVKDFALGAISKYGGPAVADKIETAVQIARGVGHYKTGGASLVADPLTYKMSGAAMEKAGAGFARSNGDKIELMTPIKRQLDENLLSKSDAPNIGFEDNGYKFKGGDPKNQDNWEEIK